MQIKSIADASSLAKLGDVKTKVLDVGAEVESRLNTQVSVFVNEILTELEAHTCRIALIGQIKAGKSSLANALIRKPGLLPTDVNPSTAVVTKVFVGAPAEKQNSALFHFFSDDEWDRLMRGGRFNLNGSGGEKRLLADGNKKLAELRQRAETRLGADYARHLGKHHLFNAVTPGLLQQYVSTGDYAQPDAAGTGTDLQVFSDITREAEVFLDGQPFAYPTVIIDTPGTNDPFFVRDEITHAYLAGADVYLVVLTAQQPLSESDLALFRMLKGLQRDKVVAVINRIDVLGNIVGDLDRLTSAVRSALQREFPNTVIPVVATSALWANAAINATANGQLPPYYEAAAVYAERLGLASRAELESWRSGEADPARIADLLYNLSGVTGVINMISRLIGNVVTEEQLLPSTSTLSAVTENTAISLRFGSNALDPTRATFHHRAPQHQALRGKTETSLNSIRRLLDSIETILREADEELANKIASELGHIEKYMFYSVDRFAEAQTDAFAIKGVSPAFRAEFMRETLKLRSELAEDFAHHFGNLYRTLTTSQRDVEAQLRQTAKSVLPSLDDVLHYGVPSSRVPSVSSISLSKVTAFDLDDFWQGAMLQSESHEEQIESFRFLVRSEFVFMLRELFDDARKDLKRLTSTSMRRLRYMTYSAIHPFIEQLRQIATHYRDVVIENQKPENPDAKLKTILDHWRNDVTAFERLAERLKTLKKQCFLIAAG